jgi:hypothetical protein
VARIGLNRRQIAGALRTNAELHPPIRTNRGTISARPWSPLPHRSAAMGKRRPGLASGRAAVREWDHPPVRAAPNSRVAAPELVRELQHGGTGGRREGKAHDPFRPFRARGVQPLQNSKADADADIERCRQSRSETKLQGCSRCSGRQAKEKPGTLKTRRSARFSPRLPLRCTQCR